MRVFLLSIFGITMFMGLIGFLPLTLRAEHFACPSDPLHPDAPFCPPENPSPPSGSRGVTLRTDGFLILSWENNPSAQWYRYQYKKSDTPWPLSDKDNEPGNVKTLTSAPESNPIPFNELAPGQKYEWRVKSCAPFDDAESGIHMDELCGLWDDSDIWTFTFALNPPPKETLTPNLETSSKDAELPITLSWGKVPLAQWYQLYATPCLNWIWFDLGEEEDEDAENGPPEECSFSIVPDADGKLEESYKDDFCYFTKDTTYMWRVSACLVPGNEASCGPFVLNEGLENAEQPVEFRTGLPPSDKPFLPSPEITAPQYSPEQPLPVISWESSLSWKSPDDCAYIHRISLTRESDGKIFRIYTKDPQDESLNMGDTIGARGRDPESISLEDFWSDANNINADFTWTVAGCWANSTGGNVDCEGSGESAPSRFRTAGTPPLLSFPKKGASVKVPIVLQWQGINGAVSYAFEISPDGTREPEPGGNFTSVSASGSALSATVAIPYAAGSIEPDKEYWWHARACLNAKATACGPWAEPIHFSTLPIHTPAQTTPANEDEVFVPGFISWQADPGASYYQYDLAYFCKNPAETLTACDIPSCARPDTEWRPKVLATNTITNSPFFSQNLACAGKYQWRVRSCADKDCALESASAYTPFMTFHGIDPPHTAGLVPCQRVSNNPNTPYNEKEPCQLKHAGFLLQNILDFVLWKLALLVFAALSAFLAASTFFSFGSADIISKAKEITRSYAYGFILLMLAWGIVNIIMSIFGFHAEFFGYWWKLPF